jgi:hypothetical protein
LTTIVLRKPEEHVMIRKRGKAAPRVYVIDEPPSVIEVNGKRYECKSIVQSPSGLLCIQYDGTAVVLPSPQPQQQQPQQKAQIHPQLV